MHLTVTSEARYVRNPDGGVLAAPGQPPYPFWTRYLTVFDSVTVLARVVDAPGPAGPKYVPADGPGVRVRPVRSYIGLAGFARRRAAVMRDIRACVDTHEGAWLARIPGLVGQLTVAELGRRSVPYAVEVVGDPIDVLRSGVLPGGGRLLARLAGRNMARACRDAIAAAYVTDGYLQRRYPPGAALRATYSSVDLPEEAFAPAPRDRARILAPMPHLLTVGMQEQRYKGHDVLIDAVSLLARRGVGTRLSIVGEGRHHEWLRRRAAASPAAGRIRFLGALGPAEVRAVLDAGDVFVLPSRTEGLPRALLEAMARGLPCVASSVGGVPELLPAHRLVPPCDAAALAGRIAALIADPEGAVADSCRNLEVARSYSWANVQPVRTAFLTAFRDARARELAPR